MAADVHQRVNELENEIKVLKNEIKAILLDIREQYLNAENPFTISGQAAGGDRTAASISILSDASRSAATHGKEEVHGEEVRPVIQSPSFPGVTSTHADSPSLSGVESVSSPDASTAHGLQLKAKEQARREAAVPLPGLEPVTEKGWSLKVVEQRRSKGAGMTLPGMGQFEEENHSLPGNEGHIRKETSRRRVKQAPDYRSGSENDAGINLITVAGLSRWVDDSVEKIGKDRTEVMVEACHVVGYLPAELKDLLVRLVRLAQVDEPKKRKIATGDYLGVIAQLDSLLGFSSDSEAALLSILTTGREVFTSNG